MPDEESRLVGVTYHSQDQTGPFPRLDASWRLLKTNVMMSLDSIAMLLRGDAGLGDLSSMIGITASVGDMIGRRQTPRPRWPRPRMVRRSSGQS